MFSCILGLLSSIIGALSWTVDILSHITGGLSCVVGALSWTVRALSGEVGVLSGNAGIDDLLDLPLLLKAPLLRIDSPRRSKPARGHVGSSGLSAGIDGGRRPTTLLTNLFRPRSIFT